MKLIKCYNPISRTETALFALVSLLPFYNTIIARKPSERHRNALTAILSYLAILSFGWYFFMDTRRMEQGECYIKGNLINFSSGTSKVGKVHGRTYRNFVK